MSVQKTSLKAVVLYGEFQRVPLGHMLTIPQTINSLVFLRKEKFNTEHALKKLKQ